MNIITLSAFDLSLAAVLVLLLAGLSLWLQLGITQQLLVASLRTVVQLMLIGVVGIRQEHAGRRVGGDFGNGVGAGAADGQFRRRPRQAHRLTEGHRCRIDAAAGV